MPSLTRSLLFRLATSKRFERLVRSTPVGERAAWRAASRYVAGRDREAAIAEAESLLRRGFGVSVDYFGEMVDDADEAARVADALVELAGALPAGAWVAIDLSHVGLDVSEAACRGHLERIAATGRTIHVGAEDSGRADPTLAIVLALARAGTPVAATVQANLLRAERDADVLVDAGVPVRLVKGAYVEPPGVARPWGDETDVAYVRLAHRIHERGGRLTLATHDPVLREALLAALPGVGVEMLLRVRPDDADELLARGVPVRIYVPYGQDWFRYWMRRTAESRGP